MAIARGAGTEIIRSHAYEHINSADTTLIYGVQHHIYTVLSVIIQSRVLQAAGNHVYLELSGYDAKAGTTAQGIRLLKHSFAAADETFVWNDKFSFNGTEPTDFTGPIDSEAKQDAIADQGSAVRQILKCSTANASDEFEILITFIDQNNE